MPGHDSPEPLGGGVGHRHGQLLRVPEGKAGREYFGRTEIFLLLLQVELLFADVDFGLRRSVELDRPGGRGRPRRMQQKAPWKKAVNIILRVLSWHSRTMNCVLLCCVGSTTPGKQSPSSRGICKCFRNMAKRQLKIPCIHF